jgi:serine/threonine protein kinase
MQRRSVKEAILSQKPSQTFRVIDSRYEIKNIFLGEGTFGEVFVCWDRVAREVLAVKAISKAKLLDKINSSKSKDKTKEFYIKSLRDEAFLMEKLDHPNIVRFNGYS